MKLLLPAVGFFLVLVSSCGQTNSSDSNKEEMLKDSSSLNPVKTISPKDTTIKFLWLAKDSEGNTSIVINEEYCKKIPGSERAALGYIATFKSNECWWDGEAKEDRSNLACKIITALDLGYQCSEKHLGFLRQWFKTDKKVLSALQACPTIPNTATVQETLDEINLTIKGDTISIWFRANGINMREDKSWSWTETNVFKIDTDNIKLVKTDKSAIKTEVFNQ